MGGVLNIKKIILELNAKNKKSNFEVSIRLGICFLFAIFWLFSGYDLIKESDCFSDFIEKNTSIVTSIFSWNLLIHLIIYLAITCYPVLIVMFISFTLFDRKAFEQLASKKSFLYFILSPLSIIGLILFLIIFKFAIGLVGSILFLGFPIYFIANWIFEKIKS